MSEFGKSILFLGDQDSPLLRWLSENEESVLHTTEKINPDFISKNEIFFLISYGYRHIIKKEILDLLPGRAINLHISYLPWNRGADPNLWSFIDDTPKGVTIHYIDEGLDTGDIIAQELIEFNEENETLASSYHKLQLLIQELFKRNWQAIKDGSCTSTKQCGQSSTHTSRHRKNIEHHLVKGWQTPVSKIRNLKSR